MMSSSRSAALEIDELRRATREAAVRRSQSPTVAIWVARALLGLLAIGLLMTRAGDWPKRWIDDGMHLSAAAVLARDGVYGLKDGLAISRFDPQVQVGPAVIVPVAIGLRVFGINDVSARFVTGLLGLGTLLAAWALARRVFDERTALLTVALLLVGSREWFCSVVFMGRQVLGEAPAFGYFSVGLLVLYQQVRADRFSWRAGLGTGLLWGAAMLSKLHLLPLIPLGMLFVAFMDLFYYRRRVWRLLALPVTISVAMVMIWQTVRWMNVAAPGVESVAQVSPAWISTQILTMEWLDRRRALGALWRSGFLLIGLPGLLYGLWTARHRNQEGVSLFLLIAVPVTCLSWFLFASIGWARYAFYPVAMSTMWGAALLWKLWDLAAQPREAPSEAWRPAGRFLLAASVTALCLVNTTAIVRAITHPVDSGFTQMREYVLANVPTSAVIETWEWEFSIDDRPNYTHPGNDTMLKVTRIVMSGQQSSASVYDWRRNNPDYVLLGPFGAWTGVYQGVLSKQGELVVQHGQYALYRVHRARPAPTPYTSSFELLRAAREPLPGMPFAGLPQ
jgi:hypothetical protein